MLIAPSMLSADFANLQRDIEMVNQSEAALFHLDIMDGLFVPNISYGFPVVKAIAKYATKPLDAHLMIVDPDRYIPQFAQLGVKYLSVHYEACTHLHRTLQLIRSNGMLAGVALNPHTPVSHLEDILEYCDFVLLMSVNPGFGGQSFIDRIYKKCSELREMINSRGLNVQIEVDGGVNLENTPKLKECGADILVAGNTVFSAKDPQQTISDLSAF
ncbi:MAG: ribulose-phosphate 3-epimerase [Bacteroidales bacterium]|nr:ribulose-phosphate 3-epimerase [Bacteroidales bacterium]